jgi:Signal transduction histidine kinase
MIADITANSVEAGADHITLECIQTTDELDVTVTDNGKGMSKETLMKAEDPFYTDGIKHPNRKVGLGIPFLIQTAEETDGSWNIQSEPGKGTTVTMKFNLANIDTPPVGNLTDLFLDVMTLPGDYDMDIHRTDSASGREYTLNRNELKDALGGELASAASQILLRKFIVSQEE